MTILIPCTFVNRTEMTSKLREKLIRTAFPSKGSRFSSSILMQSLRLCFSRERSAWLKRNSWRAVQVVFQSPGLIFRTIVFYVSMAQNFFSKVLHGPGRCGKRLVYLSNSPSNCGWSRLKSVREESLNLQLF